MNSVHAYKPALFWKSLPTMMQVCHITQNWSIVQVLLRRNWHSGPPMRRPLPNVAGFTNLSICLSPTHLSGLGNVRG